MANKLFFLTTLLSCLAYGGQDNNGNVNKIQHYIKYYAGFIVNRAPIYEGVNQYKTNYLPIVNIDYKYKFLSINLSQLKLEKKLKQGIYTTSLSTAFETPIFTFAKQLFSNKTRDGKNFDNKGDNYSKNLTKLKPIEEYNFASFEITQSIALLSLSAKYQQAYQRADVWQANFGISIFLPLHKKLFLISSYSLDYLSKENLQNKFGIDNKQSKRTGFETYFIKKANNIASTTTTLMLRSNISKRWDASIIYSNKMYNDIISKSPIVVEKEQNTYFLNIGYTFTKNLN